MWMIVFREAMKPSNNSIFYAHQKAVFFEPRLNFSFKRSKDIKMPNYWTPGNKYGFHLRIQQTQIVQREGDSWVIFWIKKNWNQACLRLFCFEQKFLKNLMNIRKKDIEEGQKNFMSGKKYWNQYRSGFHLHDRGLTTLNKVLYWLVFQWGRPRMLFVSRSSWLVTWINLVSKIQDNYCTVVS